MTAWIVYSILTGALIAVAALGAEWILKSMKRPVRAVWMVAIALTIGLTLTAPLRIDNAPVATGVALSLEDLPMAVVVEPTQYERVIGYAHQLQQAVLTPIHSVTELAASVGAAANRAVWIAALISAIAALIALAAVYRRSILERSKWPSMRLLNKSVRVTPNVGPAVLGLAPPEIVVPQWVLLRNQEEQRLVLEHESEHVRAHDPMLLMIACVAVATMPWNAAMWFMWSRLRLAVELDCDRRVLLRGAQKASYGQLLVELSSRRPWMAPAIPAFSWGTSHLEQRLVAMTARPKRFRIVRRSASGLLIASALLVATRTELPAATKLFATPAPVQRGIDGSTRYFVNGIPATQAEADAFIANNDVEITLVSEVGKKVASEFRVDTSADRKVGPLNAAFKPTAKPRTASFAQQDTIKRKPVAKKKTPPAVVKKQARVYKPTDETLPNAKDFPVKKADRVVYNPTISRDSSSVRVLQRDGEVPRVVSRTRGDTAVRVVYNESVPRVLLRSDSATRLYRSDSVIITDGAAVSGGEARIIVGKPLSPDAQGARVRVRSQYDLKTSSEPLIFVDGVLMKEGSLKLIDPNQIENVEVIKGAKAIELYGVGAENGVINIKMKRP